MPRVQSEYEVETIFIDRLQEMNYTYVDLKNYDDVVEYCKNKVLDKNCNIYKQGKNWYCEIDNIKITINSYSYTIITAHKLKR